MSGERTSKRSGIEGLTWHWQNLKLSASQKQTLFKSNYQGLLEFMAQLETEKTTEWLSRLTESVELECKLAAGRDGKGAIPRDLWETYSAFANTHGGVILLGIREKPKGRFRIEGVQNGHGRGAVYHLPGASIPTPEQVFGVAIGADRQSLAGSLADLTAYSGDNENYSGDSEGYSGDTELYSGDKEPHSSGERPYSDDGDPKNVNRDSFGRLISPVLKAPAIHDLENLTPEYHEKLRAIADPSAKSKRLIPDTMRSIILQLCSGQYVTRSCLAELLHRTPDTLRHQYLSTMVEDKSLTLAFPQTPNDKRQAYITTSSLQELEE